MRVFEFSAYAQYFYKHHNLMIFIVLGLRITKRRTMYFEESKHLCFINFLFKKVIIKFMGIHFEWVIKFFMGNRRLFVTLKLLFNKIQSNYLNKVKITHWKRFPKCSESFTKDISQIYPKYAIIHFRAIHKHFKNTQTCFWIFYRNSKTVSKYVTEVCENICEYLIEINLNITNVWLKFDVNITNVWLKYM